MQSYSYELFYFFASFIWLTNFSTLLNCRCLRGPATANSIACQDSSSHV